MHEMIRYSLFCFFIFFLTVALAPAIYAQDYFALEEFAEEGEEGEEEAEIVKPSPTIVAKEPIEKKCQESFFVPPNIDPPAVFSTTNNLTRKTSHHQKARGDRLLLEGVIRDTNCVPLSGITVRLWHADAQGHYVINEEDSEMAALSPSDTIDEELKPVTEDLLEEEGMINESTQALLDVESDEASDSEEQDALLDDEPQEESQSLADIAFPGSGMVVTDNLGRYRFLTVMPGKSDYLPPVLHIKIEDGDDQISPVMTDILFDSPSNVLEHHKGLADRVAQRMVAYPSKEPPKNIPEDILVYQYDITLEWQDPRRYY